MELNENLGTEPLTGIDIAAAQAIDRVIHDEIILECHQDRAGLASSLLVGSMTQGLLNVFPHAFTGDLTDASVITNWGDKS